MLHVVTTGAYYPPVDTTWKILTTGASQLTVVSLCIVTDENVSIIVEYAAGGDLSGQFSKDNECGNLVEHHVKIQFYQIAHAVAFLHSKNVCHRDLKLENILLLESGPTCRIKVTDFGLSKKWSSTNILETFVGTPNYMAPEVIQGAGEPSRNMLPYSCKSDCWSLGVNPPKK